ncbi:MAG: hypothetical protein U0Z53_15270 [Blastocatellia bacterium]
MPQTIQVEVRNDNGNLKLVRNVNGVERSASLVVIYEEEEVQWFSNDGTLEILFGSTETSNPFAGDGIYESTAVQSGETTNAMNTLEDDEGADYKYTVTLFPNGGATPLSLDPRVRVYKRVRSNTD